MLWVKAFHVFFVVSWFAGLLYLPRLFVYHAKADDQPGRQRFQVMERKLFVIMTMGAAGAIILGTWLLHAYAWSAYAATGWLHAKLTLVAALVVFHIHCYRIVVAFSHDEERHSQTYFRWMNEIPAVVLLAIIILTIVKPF